MYKFLTKFISSLLFNRNSTKLKRAKRITKLYLKPKSMKIERKKLKAQNGMKSRELDYYQFQTRSP